MDAQTGEPIPAIPSALLEAHAALPTAEAMLEAFGQSYEAYRRRGRGEAAEVAAELSELTAVAVESGLVDVAPPALPEGVGLELDLATDAGLELSGEGAAGDAMLLVLDEEGGDEAAGAEPPEVLVELADGPPELAAEPPELEADASQPDASAEVAAEPADAEPDDAEPVDAEPVDAEPVDAEPVDAEPADAEPADAEPAVADAEVGGGEGGDDSGLVPVAAAADAGVEVPGEPTLVPPKVELPEVDEEAMAAAWAVEDTPEDGLISGAFVEEGSEASVEAPGWGGEEPTAADLPPLEPTAAELAAALAVDAEAAAAAAAAAAVEAAAGDAAAGEEGADPEPAVPDEPKPRSKRKRRGRKSRRVKKA